MKNPFNMHLLRFEGTSFEIGRQHGEACREVIQSYTRMVQDSVKKTHSLKADEYYDLIFEEMGFYQVAEKWTPHVVEEIKGIAAGANLDVRAIFANQLLDESDWMISRIRGEHTIVDESRCSVLGAFGSLADPPIIAQNADMGKFIDGYQTLVHQRNTQIGIDTYLLTLPGIIGIYGLNNFAIGVCLNAMAGRMNKSLYGLGTIFIARGILARKHFQDAVDFTMKVPHASGEAYTIGGRTGVATLEGSANKVSRFVPFMNAEVVYHTNHAIVNDDIEITPELLAQQSVEYQARFQRGIENSTARFKTLEKHLQKRRQALSAADVIGILSAKDFPDNPVCRHKLETTDGMTTFSMVMELSEDPVLHAAGGPPCMSAFRAFRFS